MQLRSDLPAGSRPRPGIAPPQSRPIVNAHLPVASQLRLNAGPCQRITVRPGFQDDGWTAIQVGSLTVKVQPIAAHVYQPAWRRNLRRSTADPIAWKICAATRMKTKVIAA